ncbi:MULTISPECIES: pyrroloquinoline quinone biosynthesis protein PqqB [unclassified Oceanobacter]|jgi:pyrroloquinoline quinone biosynthesis protein B|uniref:pyrroloquinoline quinone biosynthesis protein PqqB n=2 Tax=Gammaproteobacteria TaxID=1236 RepID=UPI0027343A07|nr:MULTISPECIES: pyrroloquinoline quinone biosynthesis protein PqqB [unclassified Oceanobacter]MDP2547311.1 pyrroloquinoline quinone biosynthesis protein PqqB [Oceanobacter sp. 4_MG-2023]MDP2607435.1 pyrroloquinoline quinone biosynthesis protein PqqB [Oceanobacter sp. 1_MG-2023]MDP2610703.1 pyrroloquinoline quinone biosynthesis protein PqqB [Oceanobacter sp. 2_MG-2023]
MKIHVLGSAAGGGFPQWNCNCVNCKGYRDGTIKATARTQSSICVSADGERWLLFNTSPDIRAQLASFAPLQPARQDRDTGIHAIVLMDAQIDHSTGLLMLREGLPLDVYTTAPVHEDLSTGFPLFTMLKKWNGGPRHHDIPLDGRSFSIPGMEALKITAMPLDSNAPPYSPRRGNPMPGDNIGVFIEDTLTGGKLFYAPGLGVIEDHLLPWMAQADCLLVDGTLWTDDEMINMGLSQSTGQMMGHLAQSGDGGMLDVLAQYPDKRKVLIHINNTNPILNEESAERAIVEEQGVEISWDGMEIDI